MVNQTFEYIEKRKSEELVRSLDPLVKEWFFSRFKAFSDTQLYGVMPIFERKNILVSAPTGGTKTLTAFLSILNYLIMLSRRNELDNRVYAVYCSPLKALTNDIFVNLERPLQEMEEIAKKDEKKYGKLQKIRVGLRTGDTSLSERAKMAKNIPHILVTTPESLAIMINSPKFAENFSMVEWMIIDEIHSLAENKRGVHMSLTIERLQEMSKMPISRVGLSATIAPLEKIAHYLVGNEGGEKNLPRNCLIASVDMLKKLDLKVLSPVDDFLETTSAELNEKLYTLIDDLIEKHKTTLIFTNTRAATERVVNSLKEKFPLKYIENIGAHHSSLSKDHRFEIEEKLRKGELRVVVCSTSLELGIDIGFIDLVLLLGSPKAVSRAMQRIGRAGHQLHETAKGRFVVSDVDDLIECGIILKNAREKKIDEVHIPTNALDVLAQQIYGMAIYKVWNVEKMFEIVKKSYCYTNLTREDFFNVISYLAGEYELKVRNVYSKIWYDPVTREVGKRGMMARVIYMTNIGTIPDESFVSVVDKAGNNIGKLDEGFLERLKRGDVFVLGGKRYEYLYTKGMKVHVIPSLRSPTIPSWFSEMLPLSFDTAMGIQKLRKYMAEMFETKKSAKEIKEFIKGYIFNEDVHTLNTIYSYFEKQYKYSIIPHEGRILIEEYRQGVKKDKKFLIFHTLFGRRVNDAISRAVGYLVASSSAHKRDVEVGINDNGFFIAGADLNLDKAEKAFAKLNENNIEKVLDEAIENTEVLKRRFRHAAARGLMILRNYKGRVKSVGRQQMSSHFLLAAINKKTKQFPILKEARREVLEDLMDIDNAKKVLGWISEKRIKIVKKNAKEDAHVMSPFAINLILSSHADVIKVEDKIEFIKRVYAELER